MSFLKIMLIGTIEKEEMEEEEKEMDAQSCGVSAVVVIAFVSRCLCACGFYVYYVLSLCESCDTRRIARAKPSS